MKNAMFALACATACTWASAQQFDNATQRLTDQRAAMQGLSMLDGIWRGPAFTVLPDGKKIELTQTERVGAFLDGSVKVIEGRGYDSAGKVAFNAFGTVAFDPATKTYTLHSHAQSYYGIHPLQTTEDGFIWEMPAGPTKIRFTTSIKAGIWSEVGDRIMPDGRTVRFFEMKLQRIGDTTWPAGDAVPPK